MCKCTWICGNVVTGLPALSSTHANILSLFTWFIIFILFSNHKNLHMSHLKETKKHDTDESYRKKNDFEVEDIHLKTSCSTCLTQYVVKRVFDLFNDDDYDIEDFCKYRRNCYQPRFYPCTSTFKNYSDSCF